MKNTMLLETYLRQLRLPTFVQNYRKFAEDAAQNNLAYDRFLLALSEQEVIQREQNRIARRIKAARFPVLKELADFDFSLIPKLNKAKILDLARAHSDGGQSWGGQDSRRNRTWAGGMSSRAQGAFPLRRSTGQ